MAGRQKRGGRVLTFQQVKPPYPKLPVFLKEKKLTPSARTLHGSATRRRRRQSRSTMSDASRSRASRSPFPFRMWKVSVLTAGEASALNQVFHENLRNNFASKIKKLKEANGEAIGVGLFQADLDDYAKSYQRSVSAPPAALAPSPIPSSARPSTSRRGDQRPPRSRGRIVRTLAATTGSSRRPPNSSPPARVHGTGEACVSAFRPSPPTPSRG